MLVAPATSQLYLLILSNTPWEEGTKITHYPTETTCHITTGKRFLVSVQCAFGEHGHLGLWTKCFLRHQLGAALRMWLEDEQCPESMDPLPLESQSPRHPSEQKRWHICRWWYRRSKQGWKAGMECAGQAVRGGGTLRRTGLRQVQDIAASNRTVLLGAYWVRKVWFDDPGLSRLDPQSPRPRITGQELIHRKHWITPTSQGEAGLPRSLFDVAVEHGPGPEMSPRWL